MPQARIEITPDALKAFIDNLPPRYKLVGTLESRGFEEGDPDRRTLIFWIEGPDLPEGQWVTAKVTARMVYDMTFEPAPARKAPYPV
jgi:hypothetical protein